MKDFVIFVGTILLICFCASYLGAMFFRFSNTGEIYEIRTCQDLQDINKNLNSIYILMDNIDCGEYLNDK